MKLKTSVIMMLSAPTIEILSLKANKNVVDLYF